jgi:diazepam-binding inhibitor (GABA receptor modulating acyl-CoA-binding protein)
MDTDTESLFQQAVVNVGQLQKRPDDDFLLMIYGLYKQATVGDAPTSKPSMFQPKESKKWQAWDENRGKSSEECKKLYIRLVNRKIKE